MAAWPDNGDTDWNTKNRAAFAVGHSLADGTHNQEDWTPSTYAGAESITYPNGKIEKTGKETYTSTGTKTITFAAEFPTALVNIQCSDTHAAVGRGSHPKIVKGSESTTGFQYHVFDQPTDLYWVATGY